MLFIPHPFGYYSCRCGNFNWQMAIRVHEPDQPVLLKALLMDLSNSVARLRLWCRGSCLQPVFPALCVVFIDLIDSAEPTVDRFIQSPTKCFLRAKLRGALPRWLCNKHFGTSGRQKPACRKHVWGLHMWQHLSRWPAFSFSFFFLNSWHTFLFLQSFFACLLTEASESKGEHLLKMWLLTLRGLKEWNWLPCWQQKAQMATPEIASANGHRRSLSTRWPSSPGAQSAHFWSVVLFHSFQWLSGQKTACAP